MDKGAEVVGADWTPKINMLHVKCKCGKITVIRADKRWFYCTCGNVVDMIELKSIQDE